MRNLAGLISVRSAHDVAETVRRFRAAAEANDLTIFAEIDHGRNAAEVGLELRPTCLLIFGNPRSGTPLMQMSQTIGIDLPLKVLAWQDEEGIVWLSCATPQWLADRHELGSGAAQTVDAMTAGIQKLAMVATS